MSSLWSKSTLPGKLFLLVVYIIMAKTSSSEEEDVNVALGKPAVQNSVYKTLYASKGVDGNPSGYVKDGGCAHTDVDAYPAWWMVDLLTSYEIHTIKINGRNSDASRFKEFSVHLSEHNPLKSPDFPYGYKGEMCFFYAQRIQDGGATHTINCTRPVIGRYLTLYKAANEWIVLCEFQAMASVKSQSKKQFPFRLLSNYRSTKIPFYQRDGVVNSLNCGVVCLNAPGGITTMFNYQVTTGQCQCIQLSELTNNVDKEHANDTDLYVSDYN